MLLKSNLNRRQLLKTGVGIAALAGKQSAAQSAAQTHAGGQFPERIRVAIIGLEGHYSEILDAVKIIPQIEISAIAETNQELLRHVPGNPLLKNAKLYGDYRVLLDREKLDVVAVCGENGSRAATIQACAQRKIPIVAEKPLALSPQELEQTRSVVAAARVPLTILLPMRFEAEYRKMRSVVTSGEIGDVVSLAAQKSYKLGTRPDWMKNKATYGGTIPYIGIHMVDLMLYVGRHDFKSAAAFQSRVGFPEIRDMENNAVVIFQLDNRGSASLRLDYLRPETAPSHGDDRLRIAGTQGIIEYQGGALTLMTSKQPPCPITADPAAAKLLFVDFLESLYANTTHALSLDEIYRVNEIVLKAREAAETGRVIDL